MEQTLFICREVSLFKIPPRAGRGHISGAWRIEDKIFTPRCRVVASEQTLEVRLEDPANGEIFGACPVPRGERSIAVESAVDSSRNFVLRIVDPATGRHAFLGMSFAERAHAFDFNVALTDHDRHLQREEDMQKIAASADPAAAAQSALPEAAALYGRHDFALREGECMKVEVKRSGSGGTGFLARLAVGARSGSGGGVAKLAPPLAPPTAPSPARQAAPAAAAAMEAQPDLLGAAAAAAAAAFGDLSFQGAIAATGDSLPVAAAGEVASIQEGWATF